MRQVPKIFVFFIVFFFCYASQSLAACKSPETNLVNGQKTSYGSIDVLNLHGSYCEMGQQYGKLEATKLQQFYRQFEQLMKTQHAHDLAQIQQKADSLYNNYPERFKNFLQGMSETSGLTLKQEIFLNAFEHVLYYKNPTHQPGCSAVAAWGNNSINKEVIVGRNYDYFVGHPEFKKMLTVTVFHPGDGENATAMITFLGTLNATTNINDQGLYLELNNGYPSAKILNETIAHYPYRMDTTIDLLSMMLDASTLNDLNTQMHSLNSNASYIINVADADRAYSYEWTDKRVVKVKSQNNFLVSTNHFQDASWKISQQDNLWDTLTRYNNLKNLAQKATNPISVESMKKMLEKTLLQQGGATMTNTIYQVIVTPATKQCWIRLPSFADKWQQINLQKYFSS